MKRVLFFVLVGIVAISLIYLRGFKQGMFVKVEEKIVREPAVAGRFYPAEKDELERMVNSFLNNCEFKHYGRVRGLIVPRAGYIFSGQVAACGFKQVSKDVKTVIILGPSHHVYFKGFYVPNYTHFKTPLGEVKVSEKAYLLRKERLSSNVDDRLEHSIEVEVPFIQEVLGDFEIIPIMTGVVDPKELAEILLKYIDDSTIVVASSDLSHYHPYEVAKRLDESCIDSILNLSIDKIEGCEACGKIPILTLAYLAKRLKWDPKFFEYKNSGDVTGDLRSVVGYTSIGFYEGLNREEEEILLKIARETLEDYLSNASIPSINENSLPESLKENKGCFVTLYKNGRLRGCIGSLLPLEPLYRCVVRNAINAAVHDLRFFPVRKEELKDVKIEKIILFPFESKDKEERLAYYLSFYGKPIKNFGSSDSKCQSHLIKIS